MHKRVSTKDLKASFVIRASSLVRSTPKKRPMIAAVEKVKGATASSSKHRTEKRRPGDSQFYCPSHAGRRKPTLSSNSG